MSDNDDKVIKPAAAKAEKAAPAEETIELTFQGEPWSGSLNIGVEAFTVTDGKVTVPVRVIAGARQAGFR